MAQCYLDPYRFVLVAFDWGRGDLEAFSGPDKWQTAFLKALFVTSFRGYVAMMKRSTMRYLKRPKQVTAWVRLRRRSWIILWLMSTRPHFAGVVTANTRDQLTRKTWREVEIWRRRCLTGHWFKYNATSLHHVVHKDTWRLTLFRGLSTILKRSRVCTTLDAAKPSSSTKLGYCDIIWEVAEGAMSDPDAFWFTFGNPTKRSGRFYDCWHKFARRWHKFTVDSREAAVANKKRIAEMIEDWGSTAITCACVFSASSPSRRCHANPLTWLDSACIGLSWVLSATAHLGAGRCAVRR
jgi:hypothetical protein